VRTGERTPFIARPAEAAPLVGVAAAVMVRILEVFLMIEVNLKRLTHLKSAQIRAYPS
jgi:hypothetical protein